ncbi:hypothetical protein GA0070616_0103 [Micromonospora nigra]|uniref:Peptidase inhibitor family I36 n=1 Tax=Micromonospora nigra TaxID=145857 RepID=A0A1C6R7M4_9ACTN|nr:hypothetical protein [Micromonospora nigra]SCL13025.1 hypothetical protein GA0070616_0103 [Micromonospora nigra]
MIRKNIGTARVLPAALLSAVTVVATLGIAAGPASAASASCTAPYFYGGWYRTCTTGSIPANSSGHFIDVRVGPACQGSPWKVWDTVTGVTVASGKDDASRRISGLYGRSYKAKLTDACWRDKISIDNNA